MIKQVLFYGSLALGLLLYGIWNVSAGQSFTRTITLMNAAAMGGTGVTGTIKAPALFIPDLSEVALQAVWTAGSPAPSGAFTVRGSLDGTTYTTIQPIAGSGTLVGPSGAAGNSLTEFKTAMPYVQATYVNTGGTGSMTLKALVKGDANQ